MRYRKLGDSEIEVSEISLGSWLTYGEGVEREQTAACTRAAVEAGKVRQIGFSEWTIEQIQAGLEVPGARKWVSSQPQYNMIWRAPEAELIPLCAERGISQIVWSPLAQGVLAGKYRPGETPPPD